MFNDYTEPLEQIIISATEAIKERAKLIKVIDGLYQMSCETCKHRNDDDHGEVYEQFCEKCNWGTDSGIKIENMKCNEWEAR